MWGVASGETSHHGCVVTQSDRSGSYTNPASLKAGVLVALVKEKENVGQIDYCVGDGNSLLCIIKCMGRLRFQ